MPYVPFSESPPSKPVVICADGWYFAQPRTRKRSAFPCVAVEVRALTVAQVAATYEGDAQERAEALAQLTEGQRLALYPPACACGQNHFVNVQNLLRAWDQIHPDARGAMRGLPVRDYIRIAALQGDEPRETLELQVGAAARACFGSV